jgi:hypothetical protein
MQNYFLSELKIIIVAKKFFIILVISCLLININFLFESYQGNYVDVFVMVLWYGILPMIAPLLCNIPTLSNRCDEKINFFYRFTEYRFIKKNNYFYSKYLGTGVSGGLILLLSVICLGIICILFFPALNSNGVSNPVLANGLFSPVYPIGNGIPFILIQALLAFLFGFLWSTIGLTLSFIIPNKYFCVGFTLILYYILNYIMRLNNIMFLSPREMLIPDSILNYSLLYIFIVQISFLTAILLLSKYLYKHGVKI